MSVCMKVYKIISKFKLREWKATTKVRNKLFNVTCNRMSCTFLTFLWQSFTKVFVLLCQNV